MTSCSDATIAKSDIMISRATYPCLKCSQLDSPSNQQIYFNTYTCGCTRFQDLGSCAQGEENLRIVRGVEFICLSCVNEETRNEDGEDVMMDMEDLD